ncbi:hypothetical protein V6Z11_D02G090200 [Gossypium hirsutum]
MKHETGFEEISSHYPVIASVLRLSRGSWKKDTLFTQLRGIWIPCTADLLTTSSMQLALLVQPMALPHPSEDPIQVLDFGESGHVRCSRCKGYINPFMKFID